MLPFLAGPTEFYRTAAGLAAQAPARATIPAAQADRMISPWGYGAGPEPVRVGGLYGVPRIAQSNKSYVWAGYPTRDDYSDAFNAAGAAGKTGNVPQPLRVSRRAFLPRVGVVFMSQNRQPFPTNRIAYLGVAPTALFPTVKKPFPWETYPYNAGQLTPSAPGGAK
jgi:hypothetical protein